jgi:hypothetical protein
MQSNFDARRKQVEARQATARLGEFLEARFSQSFNPPTATD